MVINNHKHNLFSYVVDIRVATLYFFKTLCVVPSKSVTDRPTQGKSHHAVTI